ncbi:MAG TPA: formyltransferase family protein [Baekduia sp.]|nr:formyltransferase family protein [Baekduia sp.]
MSRLVLLAPPSLNRFQRAVVEHVLAHRRGDVVGCVIDARPPRPAWERIRSNLKRGRGGYVVVMAAGLLLRRRRPTVATGPLLAAAGAEVIATADPCDPATAAAIAGLAPDVLLLVGGFGIVKEPLLSLCPGGVLSYHHGDMRAYRGQPPAFWELYHGEPSMGVTVQRLAAGIDCGTPIVERRFEIAPHDTVRSLSRRIHDGSADMLLAAVDRVERGEAGEPLAQLGRVYTLPNLREWLTCQLRVARRASRARARSLVRTLLAART